MLVKEIGEVLENKRKEKNYSLADMQTLLKRQYGIDIDPSNVMRYEKGTVKTLNPKYLRAMCKILNVDYVPFFIKLGFLDSDINLKSNVIKIPLNDVIEVPVYGQASAGNGFVNMEKIIRYIPFLKGNFSKNSFFVKVCGDSMFPTIPEGSLALVDPEQSEYLKGKIYVVTYNDETFIKRVERIADVDVTVLKSDNPSYDDIWIKGEEHRFLKIEGRVIKSIKEEEF